jgi:hypothetical protein
MLYYRTHASRVGDMPPELVGWVSPHVNAALNEQTIGEHRVLAITPPFVFAAPATGWVKLCAGWEVAATGDSDIVQHARTTSPWLVMPRSIAGSTWLLPIVLNEKGTRAFKVRYAGESFEPTMSDEQRAALAVANEARTCHDSGTWPEGNVLATWVANLLPLVYHLSPRSLGVIGLPEDVVTECLAVAGGYADATQTG